MRLRIVVALLLVHALVLSNAQGNGSRTDPGDREGTTPAKVVIDRIVSFPEHGNTDVLLLRNLGGQTADLRGWWLSDSRDNKHNTEGSYHFGRDGCGNLIGIPPAGVLELVPFTNSNPCGIPFGLSEKDEIRLYNENDEEVADATWDWSLQGLTMRRMPNGEYKRLKENSKIPEVLNDHDDLSTFKQALHATGLMEKLWMEEGANRTVDVLPFAYPNDAIPIQLPLEMNVKVGEANTPKEKEVDVDGVPDNGPYTLFAPSNAAFDAFFENTTLGKGGLSRYDIMQLPEFKDILLAHILPGRWMTGFMLTGHAMPNAAGAELIPLKDGKITEGKIILQIGCSDVPPPGEFSCTEQKKFGKCERPYIRNQGFCKYTCGRCAGETKSVSQIFHPDIYAVNGILHKVDHVIDPSGATSPDLPQGGQKAPLTGDLEDAGRAEPTVEDDDDDDDDGDRDAVKAVLGGDVDEEEDGRVVEPVILGNAAGPGSEGGDDDDDDDDSNVITLDDDAEEDEDYVDLTEVVSKPTVNLKEELSKRRDGDPDEDEDEVDLTAIADADDEDEVDLTEVADGDEDEVDLTAIADADDEDEVDLTAIADADDEDEVDLTEIEDEDEDEDDLTAVADEDEDEDEVDLTEVADGDEDEDEVDLTAIADEDEIDLTEVADADEEDDPTAIADEDEDEVDLTEVVDEDDPTAVADVNEDDVDLTDVADADEDEDEPDLPVVSASDRDADEDEVDLTAVADADEDEEEDEEEDSDADAEQDEDEVDLTDIADADVDEDEVDADLSEPTGKPSKKPKKDSSTEENEDDVDEDADADEDEEDKKPGGIVVRSFVNNKPAQG